MVSGEDVPFNPLIIRFPQISPLQIVAPAPSRAPRPCCAGEEHLATGHMIQILYSIYESIRMLANFNLSRKIWDVICIYIYIYTYTCVCMCVSAVGDSMSLKQNHQIMPPMTSYWKVARAPACERRSELSIHEIHWNRLSSQMKQYKHLKTPNYPPVI